MEKLNEELFWKLIKLIDDNQKLVPENVLKEIKEIVGKVKNVLHCPIARPYGPFAVNYREALDVLIATLRNNYQDFPKGIKEKLDNFLE